MVHDSNISGAGITAVLGGELARNLPLGLAAFLLASIVFLPTVVFLAIPSPVPTGDWREKASPSSTARSWRCCGGVR